MDASLIQILHQKSVLDKGAHRGYCCHMQATNKESAEVEMQLYKVPEAAKQLGVSTRTAWRMVRERELEVVRIRRSVRIPDAAIRDLIRANSSPARVA